MPALHHLRGLVLIFVGQRFDNVAGFVTRSVPQPLQADSANLRQPLAEFLDRDAELTGRFFLGGGALQTLLRRGHRRFDLARFAPLLARHPVHFTQAVQNRPPDLVLRIGLELDVEARIEVVNGRNEAENPGRNQVVQADVLGESLLDAPGDQPHLRHVP